MSASGFGSERLSDRYRIGDLIGSGGMADVYRAHDLRHDRDVAVKILKPELSAAIATERFMREIAIVARLTHPHILPLYDSGQSGELLYYVMPFVEGGALSHRLRRHGPLPVREAAEMARSVASALDYAHRREVVHRDVKPANILLHDGEALLSDFGVAVVLTPDTSSERLTVFGTAIGTPQYMSPEQTFGEDFDGRSDIFSLGTVLYEMLTGKCPFDATGQEAITSRVRSLDPPPIQDVRPELPARLAATVAKALAKDPSARFQRALEMADALEESITGVANVVRPTPKRPWWPWLVAAVVTASLAGIFGDRWFGAAPQIEAAERQFTFTGDARAAAIAPDGQMVAFLADGGRSLQIQDVDGGEAATVMETSEVILSRPRWSSDGRELFFHGRVDSTWGVYSVRRLGGDLQLRARVSPSHLDLLPNDQGYVLGSFAGNLEIRGVDGRRRPVSSGSDIRWLWNVAVSPSGRWIAFLGERPDGSALIGTVGTGRTARTVLVEGGNELLITAEGLSGNRLPFPQVLGWEPEDRAVYFRRRRARGADILRVEVNPESGRPTGPPVPVVTGLPGNAGFDVGPGGSIMYYGGSVRTSLQLIDIGSGRGPARQWSFLSEGTAHHINPTFSPDGRQAAYRRAASAASQLFLQPVDGGVARRVVTSGDPQLFGWAPDGTRLAVLQSGPGGVELSVISLQGEDEALIEGRRASASMRPAWSRDGGGIVYQSADLSQLLLLDLATQTQRGLLEDSVTGAFAGALFSPDGDRVVLRRYDEVAQPGLWLLSLEGGTLRLLLPIDGMPLLWTDDDWVYFLQLDTFAGLAGSVVRRVRSSDRQLEDFAALPFPCHFLNVALAPDLSRVMCSTSEVESDIWMIGGFN